MAGDIEGGSYYLCLEVPVGILYADTEVVPGIVGLSLDFAHVTGIVVAISDESGIFSIIYCGEGGKGIGAGKSIFNSDFGRSIGVEVTVSAIVDLDILEGSGSEFEFSGGVRKSVGYSAVAVNDGEAAYRGYGIVAFADSEVAYSGAFTRFGTTYEHILGADVILPS